MYSFRNANCIGDYDGVLDVSNRVHGSCGNGNFNMDAYVIRQCIGSMCDSMRIRPFAKVSYVCESADVFSVSCI